MHARRQCAKWAKKALALASYAKRMRDEALLEMAKKSAPLRSARSLISQVEGDSVLSVTIVIFLARYNSVECVP
jgi:hypothetical protein